MKKSLFLFCLFFIAQPFDIPQAWQLRFLPNLDVFLFPVSGVGQSQNVDDLTFYTKFMLENNIGNGFHIGVPWTASIDHFKMLANTPGFKSNIVWSIPKTPVKDLDAKQNLLKEANIHFGVHYGEWGNCFTCQDRSNCDWDIFGLYRCCDRYPPPFNTTSCTPVAPYQPDTRPEAHDIIRGWVQKNLTIPFQPYGGLINFNGNSHYNSYAARWGVSCAGIEIGANVMDTQTKVMIARSATRSTGVPFCVDMSPWFGPKETSAINETTYHYGHSHSFIYRVWAYAWFVGAAEIMPEASAGMYTWGQPPSNKPWRERNFTLTDIGKMASKMLTIFQKHDRGISYTPMAIVMDYYLGYGGSLRAPPRQQQWGIFQPTTEEFALYEFFETQLLQLDNPYQRRPDTFTANQESLQLRGTPLGDLSDAILSDVNATILGGYPVVVLVGQIELNRFDFLNSLIEAADTDNNLEKILIPSYLAEEISEDSLEKMNKTGIVEILQPWLNPKTNGTSFISNQRLQQIYDKYIPFKISSSIPVQYSINKNSRGWVIFFSNNAGILKLPLEPPTVDESFTVSIQITPREDFIKISHAIEWLTQKPLDGNPFKLALCPGEFAFVELF